METGNSSQWSIEYSTQFLTDVLITQTIKILIQYITVLRFMNNPEEENPLFKLLHIIFFAKDVSGLLMILNGDIEGYTL